MVATGRIRWLAPALAFLLVLAAVPTPVTAEHATVRRVAGDDRVDTAVELSQALGPAPADVDTVVLARADRYADALAGAPLAASLGAPLLLTASDGLSGVTRAEIGRLGVSRAILLGGVDALSEQVRRDLEAAGVQDVDRLSGDDRFATAARIAQELDTTSVYAALGVHPDPTGGWPDAIAVSGLAAHQARPILLVEHGALPDATRDALRATEEVVVVGGPAAVDDRVLDELADPDGDGTAQVAVGRVAGRDRYETSALVADRAIAAGANPADVWLATGRDWPDGLAAGAAVGPVGGVLLLSDGDHVFGGGASWAWLADRATGLDRLGFVGGPAAIAAHIELTARQVSERGVAPVAGAFDADRATAFAEALADEIGPRPGGSSAETAAAARVADAFEAAGWTTVTETFALPQGGTSRNVVAWLGEPDPRGGPHVVIGGHIDTVQDSPGANDNASGTGAIVALAEELADEPSPVPLVLVGFGAEEYQPSQPRQHHVGSEVYAAAHGDHVVGMVSVDMIGVGGPTCICWWRDGTSAGAARLDAVRAQAGLSGFDVQAKGDVSDHGPFARRGVPAALLSTPSDSRYHTPYDTSGYLERETIRRSGDLTLAFVRTLTVDDRDGLRRLP